MVYEVLGEGAENARTGKEICKILNLTQRELTQVVERERRAGMPICASTGIKAGYYRAATQKEMERYCASLLRREKEIGRTRRACKKSIKVLPPEE